MISGTVNDETFLASFFYNIKLTVIPTFTKTTTLWKTVVKTNELLNFYDLN